MFREKITIPLNKPYIFLEGAGSKPGATMTRQILVLRFLVFLRTYLLKALHSKIDKEKRAFGFELGWEWKNHHGKYWYEGRRMKAFNFSRDSNYDQLLGKVYNVIGIDRDHYRVSMSTLPQTFRLSMPIEIVDDEDVALLLRRENVDPLVCISVEEIGHETP
ncbi:hypothetical protein Ddye_017191 [Dipteronia dyeriana]|uniref:Uncharacterized protein n=1 Tax=Dipteronia dyeriana TaxID=168575 RepID=A0AAD9U888_9ROSI|nr:hypothetical protein Ddye_017191 [Dipteronia dyeriana]